MNKKIIYLALGLVLVGATGCNKKLGQFKSSFFSTVPTPLETVGENVPGTVKGSIPAKFMVKNAKVTATPVISWKTASGNDSEVLAKPVIFQGEDVRANGQVVDYKNGGNVSIPFSVAYNPGMSSSELFLDFTVDQNGKIYRLPRVKVGYGVVATSTLASAKTVTPALAKDDFQKVITEKYSADIHFLINQANIRANQTNKADYIDLNKRLMEANQAPNQEIAAININSYASPEGSYDFNEKLAQKRERTPPALWKTNSKRIKSLSSVNSLPLSHQRTGKDSRNSWRRAIFRTKTLYSAYFACIPIPSSANVRSATSPPCSTSSPTRFFPSSAIRA